jgi:hypothetical protein
MKIYIITDGWYSDYGITAVFDDKEKAEIFKQIFGSDNIEEWEVNPIIYNISEGNYLFKVEMDRNGNVANIYKGETRHFQDDPTTEAVFTYGNKQILMNVVAKDETHATKIVNENRTRMIAENKW